MAAPTEVFALMSGRERRRWLVRVMGARPVPGRNGRGLLRRRHRPQRSRQPPPDCPHPTTSVATGQHPSHNLHDVPRRVRQLRRATLHHVLLALSVTVAPSHVDLSAESPQNDLRDTPYRTSLDVAHSSPGPIGPDRLAGSVTRVRVTAVQRSSAHPESGRHGSLSSVVQRPGPSSRYVRASPRGRSQRTRRGPALGCSPQRSD